MARKGKKYRYLKMVILVSLDGERQKIGGDSHGKPKRANRKRETNRTF